MLSLVCVTFSILQLLACSTVPLSSDYRVVGGYDADISSAPYQVSLMRRGSHHCGGSVVVPDLVVTAAHCVQGLNTAEFSVRAGSSSNRRGGQVIHVSDMLWHSGANAKLDNDIALLLLASPLQYNSKVSSIPLQSQNETMIGGKAIISGWGSLSEDGASPETLQMATVLLVSLDACRRSYSSILPVTPTMVCAGVVDGGRDSCQGNSGGPLVVNSVLVGIVAGGFGCGRAGYPGVYTRGDSGGPLVVNSVLVGIVAGGFGCGRAGYPGIYTRVSAYRGWIESAANHLRTHHKK